MSSCDDSARSTRYRTHLAPRALRDADAIYSLIAEDSVRAAEHWYAELAREIESLSIFPHRCPLARDEALSGMRVRALVFGSYRILFTIDEDGRLVDVARVRHGARSSIERADLEID